MRNPEKSDSDSKEPRIKEIGLKLYNQPHKSKWSKWEQKNRSI